MSILGLFLIIILLFCFLIMIFIQNYENIMLVIGLFVREINFLLRFFAINCGEIETTFLP